MPPVRLIALIFALALLPLRAAPYDDWIAGFPSLSGEAASPTADPDADGQPNLMEYALDGFDPTASDNPSARLSLPRPYYVLRAADGSYGSPVTSYTPAQAAAATSIHMVIRYKPRAGVEGLRFIPMTNQGNLNHWGFGDSAIIEWDADGYRWARSIINMKEWKYRAFMRLRVEVIE